MSKFYYDCKLSRYDTKQYTLYGTRTNKKKIDKSLKWILLVPVPSSSDNRINPKTSVF